MGMTKKSSEELSKIEAWIRETFPDAKWYRYDEMIMDHNLYMWVIDLFYLHMVMAINDLDYRISGKFEVLMEEEDTDDLISEEYNALTFDEFTKGVKSDLKRHKNRINAAKYLVETIRKQERDQRHIDMVNKIIEDSGV